MKSLADLREFLRSYPYRKRLVLVGIYLIVEALRRHYYGDQTTYGFFIDATVIPTLLSNPKKAAVLAFLWYIGRTDYWNAYRSVDRRC